MWLSKQIREDVQDIRVFYLNWAASRAWNERRDKGEPMVFTGWYWSHRGHEGGPFKSMSSCYRDAWFRVIQKREPPRLQQAVAKIDARLAREKRREEAEAEAVRGAQP